MKYKQFNSVLASVIIHLILAVMIGLFLSEQYWGLDDNAMNVEFVNQTKTRDNPLQKHRTLVHATKRQQVNSKPFHPQSISQIPKTQQHFQNVAPTPVTNIGALEHTEPTVQSLQTEISQKRFDYEPRNSMDVTATPTDTPRIKSRSPMVVRPKTYTATKDVYSDLLDEKLPDLNPSEKMTTTLENPILLPRGELGAILEGTGQDIRGHVRIIRLKHSLSDWWQDPTALPSLMKWMDKHTTIRLDMSFEGGTLRLTDPKILDAPLIVMTGHDKDITVGRGLAKEGPLQNTFSEQERAALRKYIVDEGGMLFFDDCGFHGLFAHIVAEELAQIFPEYPLDNIPYEHEIYSIHYHLPKPPTGGDVFWGNENNAQPSQFRFQKGIIIDNRLAVVYNRKDYMCAMETAEIESRTMLRLRRSPDVYRFMTNLMIYALKYGGNTDRSGYVE